MLKIMKLFILLNEYGQEILQDVFLFEISRVKGKTISVFFASQKQRLLDLTLKQEQEDNSVPLNKADLRKIFKDASMKMQCSRHLQQKCCCNFDVKDDIDMRILDFDVSLMSCILLNCTKLQSIDEQIKKLRKHRNKLSHISKEGLYSDNVNLEFEKTAKCIIAISSHLGTWCELKAKIKIDKLKLSDDIGIPKVRKSENF